MSYSPNSGSIDTRPKGMGTLALILGGAAVVLAIVALVTGWILTVGLVISIIAILVGAAAIVVGIIVLVKREHGFKAGGILGIVGGVIAGLAWFPFWTGLVLLGLNANS